MIPLLLLLLLLPALPALRPSHRAPLVFVPTPLESNRSEARGTSIRSDGAWRRGLVPEDAAARVREVFPLATLLAVNTDDEPANRERILAWVQRECEVVLRRAREDCFVLSALSYEPFKSALDPYAFRKWESAMRTRVKHALAPLEIRPLGSARPTFALTPSPVVPDACEERVQADCAAPCDWYGAFHGCKRGVFCGFSTKMACEHQSGCEFVRGRCRAVHPYPINY